MGVDQITIRRLAGDTAADAALYRGIRLEALKDSPEAFGSTFATESAQPARSEPIKVCSGACTYDAQRARVG
jgi:hypothetical protein